MPSVDLEKLSPDELREAWPALSDEDRRHGFIMLSDEEAEEFLSHLPAHDIIDLLISLPEADQRRWLRFLPDDDVTDIIQEAPEEQRNAIIGLLDAKTRLETRELLEYDEDEAGGLMTTRFARLRASMTAAQAIEYLRNEAPRNAETIYYAFVVDADDKLVGVVSFRDLVIARVDEHVSELMTTDVVAVPDEMDQEELSRRFAHEDLYCLPVVDADGRIKGIVTADDIVDVVDEEATEDMHKMGGSEALESPYLRAGILQMLRARGGWLVGLLLLGFATVHAMSQYEESLAKDLAVLVVFVPLIISCGGNTGSQAAMLVVRAMALDELRLRDWWRVVQRELAAGVGLGAMLAVTGLLAGLGWNGLTGHVSQTPMLVFLAVSTSILCVVLWGTIAGSMLPFLLRLLGADPASSSAPLVATIVDASGILIYFTVGGAILRSFGGA